ncbi:MAG: abortive infection family protein [Polyangiaceae bacterium]|nr:abortive infection family protein [Polyangiaceae bacterium]
MIPFDELVPHYRRARDRWSTAPALVAHYHTLVEAYEGTGQALIEAVKSFVECVCRTIITDYGGAVPGDPSATELLVAALERLGLRNSRGASRFDRVLSAHNKLADALSDCRNQDGPLAHGKDGYLDALGTHHVRMYLLTGDTILALLLGALEGTQPDLNHTREPYERFAHFNSAIDRNVGVYASVDLDDRLVILSFGTPGLPDGLELRVEPSRLLYQLDRTAFIEVLESLPRALDIEDAVAIPEAASGVPASTGSRTFQTLPTRLVASYSGPLNSFTAGLEAELLSLDLSVPPNASANLVASLLSTFEAASGLDWAQRPAMRARVLVGFKHVLRSIGARRSDQRQIAERLVEWFAARCPAGAEVTQ